MAGSTTTAPRIGVLALQGDFREHLAVLRGFGADAVPLRRASELAEIDGLVIPGGESSVMDKLARTFGVRDPLREAIAGGLPVYGTCAGLIMLSSSILDGIEGQESLGAIDIDVRRNAFGRQVDSFEEELTVTGLEGTVHAVFIRAPWVEEIGPEVEVLASAADHPVAVRQGAVLATSFHPEVGADGRLHGLFVDLVRSGS